MRYRVFFLLGLLALVPVLAAQKYSGPKYDLASETTLQGVVDDVKEVPNVFSGKPALHILLKTGDGVQEVQVAPVSFLKDMDMSFTKGEQLKITGSRIAQGGSPLLLAREILKGGNQIVIRDKEGVPVWIWMMKG